MDRQGKWSVIRDSGPEDGLLGRLPCPLLVLFRAPLSLSLPGSSARVCSQWVETWQDTYAAHSVSEPGWVASHGVFPTLPRKAQSAGPVPGSTVDGVHSPGVSLSSARLGWTS